MNECWLKGTAAHDVLYLGGSLPLLKTSANVTVNPVTLFTSQATVHARESIPGKYRIVEISDPTIYIHFSSKQVVSGCNVLNNSLTYLSYGYRFV